MINYLVLSPNPMYSQEQMRAYKGLEAHNQFTSGWVREVAVSYPKENIAVITGRAGQEMALSHLKPEQICQAFDKTKLSFAFSMGTTVLLREREDITRSIEFGKENFVQEAVVADLGEEWSSSNAECWLGVIQQGLSFILVDGTTKNIIALCLLSIESKTTHETSNVVPTSGFDRLNAFLNYHNDLVNYFDRYNVTELIDLYLLAIDKKYRNNGIGTQLTNFVIEYARNLLKIGEVPKTCLKVEAMSQHMRSICEGMKFDVLHEGFFEEFSKDGQQAYANLSVTPNKSCTFLGLQIE